MNAIYFNGRIIKHRYISIEKMSIRFLLIKIIKFNIFLFYTYLFLLYLKCKNKPTIKSLKSVKASASKRVSLLTLLNLKLSETYSFKSLLIQDFKMHKKKLVICFTRLPPNFQKLFPHTDKFLPSMLAVVVFLTPVNLISQLSILKISN